MKYLVSYRTALRVSRYLFRGLSLLVWLVGVLLSIFYITSMLHEKENAIREQLFANFTQNQAHISHLAEALRGLKYITENELNRAPDHNLINGASPIPPLAHQTPIATSPSIVPLNTAQSCKMPSNEWCTALTTLSNYLHVSQSQYASTYEISNIYLIDQQNDCVGNFSFRNSALGRTDSLRVIQDHILIFKNSSVQILHNPIYWLSPGHTKGTGSYFMSLPIYSESNRIAELVVEQNLRLDEGPYLANSANSEVTMLITDRNNRIVLSEQSDQAEKVVNQLPASKQWFGYTHDYRAIVLKNALTPGPFSLVYIVSTSLLVDQMRLMLLNTLLFNLFSGLILICITLLFERRMLQPALSNALRLEEHEQFNRKIVASAPVGICILRTSDGGNILSNELAHNYLNRLTPEDRNRVGEVIRGQEVHFMDILTAANTNLQMSFVHSRYRNEDVAICVLIDVSARVLMEKSLQEMADAAEQANQSKSMFLATVSHELRTPLYGIIGNLDLLQTRQLPENIYSLIKGMHNSSSLLLKIINDILDFSKIESEQLKISPVQFSPYEVLSHIQMNFLPLVIRKRLAMWCLVETNVPQAMLGDPIRLQQVISNLLSNAIKFTHIGGIILHLWCEEGYLHILVRDTGIGIRQRDLLQLFDPFYQVEGRIQRNFQGTGLGLAICEKLVNMMEGDIRVESEPDVGSEFHLRLPIWEGIWATAHSELVGKQVTIAVKNRYFAEYLQRTLTELGIEISQQSGACAVSGRVLITDRLASLPEIDRHLCILCSHQHNDKPQKTAEGYWITTPANAYQLPNLLEKLWQTESVEQKSVSASILPVVKKYDDYLILVVDDHPINRLLLSEQLTTLGYSTRTAKDGLDALQVAAAGGIDLILTDVNMPNLDGCGLAQRLRSQGETCPIIGVTANALAKEQQQCLDAGMNDCLSKPITLDELRRALQPFSQRP